MPLLPFWSLSKSERLQLRAVFEWVGQVAAGEDVILVDFGRYKAFFQFRFPLRFGDMPKVVRRIPHGTEPTFIIRGYVAEPPRSTWTPLFRSSELEVWESQKRAVTTAPLRWGLSEGERNIALKIARDSLELFLKHGERLEDAHFRNLPERFSLKADVAVALWVDGSLRGSMVKEGERFCDGIAHAAREAVRDIRFKPLSPPDLSGTRIEVMVISSLRIPIVPGVQEVSPEKGYFLEEGDLHGWFFPEVFNTVRFETFHEFLGRLASEKAGIRTGDYRRAKIFLTEISDFIESEDQTRHYTLYGPVTKKETRAWMGGCSAAADWLLRIQEPDGSIPSIIDPFAPYYKAPISWSRVAFTALALAEFGKTARNEVYQNSARLVFRFLSQYTPLFESLPVDQFVLLRAYLGKLAFALGHEDEALACGGRITERLDTLPFNSLSFSQTAGLFTMLNRRDARFGDLADKLLKILEERFTASERVEEDIPLALWAEAAAVAFDRKPAFAARVISWLKAQQLPTGAFPSSTRSNFAYTRGTGKVFEVLTLNSSDDREAIEKSLTWLFEMQYDDGNLFFIPPQIRSLLHGGFRHDYLNQSAWIDAAGHVLLGGARLLAHQPKQ